MVGVSCALRSWRTLSGHVRNLRINFRSEVWVGYPLCFTVFAAGMVSVVLLGCEWRARWVSCGPGALHSRVARDALRWPGGGSVGGMPLVALVLGGWGPGGEELMGLTFYLAYFFQ